MGKTIGDYMQGNLSTGFMSRDSRAASQGMRVPAHLYYLAVMYQCDTRIKSIKDFLALARRLMRQIELQAANSPLAGAEQKPVHAVLAVCARFDLVARQLTQRRQNRPTLEINDEYGVQDLLHSLLGLYFDDIRPEEWTPSYAGGASRTDFLLKEEQIVIEAKMTRQGLGAKEVSDELIIDATRYRQHPDCKTLVCMVYDPGHLVKNPRGVERDLGKLSDDRLEVICVITPS